MTCRNHQKMLFSFFTDMVIVILLLHNIWIKTYIIKFLTRKKKNAKVKLFDKSICKVFLQSGLLSDKDVTSSVVWMPKPGLYKKKNMLSQRNVITYFNK